MTLELCQNVKSQQTVYQIIQVKIYTQFQVKIMVANFDETPASLSLTGRHSHKYLLRSEKNNWCTDFSFFFACQQQHCMPLMKWNVIAKKGARWRKISELHISKRRKYMSVAFCSSSDTLEEKEQTTKQKHTHGYKNDFCTARVVGEYMTRGHSSKPFFSFTP